MTASPEPGRAWSRPFDWSEEPLIPKEEFPFSFRRQERQEGQRLLCRVCRLDDTRQALGPGPSTVCVVDQVPPGIAPRTADEIQSWLQQHHRTS